MFLTLRLNLCYTPRSGVNGLFLRRVPPCFFVCEKVRMVGAYCLPGYAGKENAVDISAENQMVREMARDFARNELWPIAGEM